MTKRAKVSVGSRISPLSVVQTEEVLAQLRVRFPEYEFLVVPITTSGDRQKDVPLLDLGRGSFVKEVELALLSGEIDFAVHSAKDLLSTLPEGLMLAAVSHRLDPRDVQINRWGKSLNDLPKNARVGTSSTRRSALVKSIRSDITILPIRGNVNTRLDKILSVEYDGVILAAAGIIRIGRDAEITEYLDPSVFIPEVGQGALAIEARSDDTEIIEMLSKIDHKPSRIAIEVERSFLEFLGGGCGTPISAYARFIDKELKISTVATTLDGDLVYRADMTVQDMDSKSAGFIAAQGLLSNGAKDIIESP